MFCSRYFTDGVLCGYLACFVLGAPNGKGYFQMPAFLLTVCLPMWCFNVSFCVLCAFTFFFRESPDRLVHIVLCFGLPCLLVPGQTSGILVVQFSLRGIHSVAIHGKFAGPSHWGARMVLSQVASFVLFALSL